MEKYAYSQKIGSTILGKDDNLSKKATVLKAKELMLKEGVLIAQLWKLTMLGEHLAPTEDSNTFKTLKPGMSWVTDELVRKNDYVSWKGEQLKRPEDVGGFNALSNSDKILFKAYLKNYYQRWDNPEEHIPVTVERTNKGENFEYLRVDFKDGWLHIKNEHEWY